MKSLFGFAIFLVSLSPAFGTVITSTSCSASALGVSDSDSGATSCGAVASPFGPNGGGSVFANATISNTQALNANTYETTFTLNVFTRGNPDLFGQAVATASGSNS